MRRSAYPPLASLWTLVAVALIMAVALPAEARRRRPAQRYHVAVLDAVASQGVPRELPNKAEEALKKVLQGHAEFMTELPGAPDPKQDPNGYKAYIKRKRMRSFGVTLRVARFEKSIVPNTRPGKRGKLLTVRVDVSMVGASIPEAGLALSGEGAAAIEVETGNRVRPREEQFAIEDALHQALAHAVEEASRRLEAARRAKKKR